MWIGLKSAVFVSTKAANTDYWVRATDQLLSRSGTYAALAAVTITEISVTTVSGSAVIVTGDTSDLVDGMFVEGSGIPAGSTISSIDVNGTDFTISNNATASGTITLGYSFTGLGDGTNFKIGSDNRFVCYNVDAATGNAVKVSSLSEDTAPEDTDKHLIVTGSGSVFMQQKNVLKNTLQATVSTLLSDSTSIAVDCDNEQEQEFTLTSGNTATTLNIQNLVDGAACALTITISSPAVYTYTFSSTGLTCKVNSSAGAEWEADNDIANQEYRVIIRRIGTNLLITPSPPYLT